MILIVDPYELWHNTAFHPELVSTNERYRNAGLIRKHLYPEDAEPAVVLVGTSMSQNTFLDELKTSFNRLNGVRLVASGSYPKEQFIQLKDALASESVDIVVWEMYRNWTDQNFDKYPRNYDFPSYLYDESWKNELKILFNDSFVKLSLDRILGEKTYGTSSWSDDLNSVSSWENRIRRAGDYQKWSGDKNRVQIEEKRLNIIEKNTMLNFDDDLVIPRSIEKYINPLITQYPETRFIFYFPPVSIVRAIEDLDINRLDIKFKFERDLVALANEHENMTIFSFNRDYDIINKMGNYKDSGHYSRDISLEILETLSSPDYVTPSVEQMLLDQHNFDQAMRSIPIDWN